MEGRFAEIVWGGEVPQRLKPRSIVSIYGTAKAVPLTKDGFGDGLGRERENTEILREAQNDGVCGG